MQPTRPHEEGGHYARLLLLRADAFASIDTVEDLTPTTVNSTTAVQLTSDSLVAKESVIHALGLCVP
jgi:hypothetical protein